MVLGIYGAGGAGREAREIAELTGKWDEIVLIDDIAEEGTICGSKRLRYETFRQKYGPEDTEIIVAVGEPVWKGALYSKAALDRYSFARLIHPTAYVSPSAVLGNGIIIKMGSFISCDTVIGDNSSVEVGCMIAHDCKIEENCQISSGVSLGGGCVIRKGVFIGMNACIREMVEIGEDSIVGIGAVVLHDIPKNAVAWGNPAEVRKPRNGVRVFHQG